MLLALKKPVSGPGIRNRFKIKPWIQLLIKAYADKQQCLKLFLKKFLRTRLKVESDEKEGGYEVVLVWNRGAGHFFSLDSAVVFKFAYFRFRPVHVKS